MFDTKEGYYIIRVNGNTYYMREHPKAMYASMLDKGNNAFTAFHDTNEDKIKAILIDELKKYIREVENV
jgi:hypothetical protein